MKMLHPYSRPGKNRIAVVGVIIGLVVVVMGANGRDDDGRQPQLARVANDLSSSVPSWALRSITLQVGETIWSVTANDLVAAGMADPKEVERATDRRVAQIIDLNPGTDVSRLEAGVKYVLRIPL